MRWKTRGSEKSRSCVGDMASGTLGPSPAARAAAAAGSTRGKTCTNIRSLLVSCWYLYCPAHSSARAAPLSSANPMPLRAEVSSRTRPSLYFCRTFLPPPTTNDRRTILPSGSGLVNASVTILATELGP